MKAARYVGGGRIEIQDCAEPECPPGGLVVQASASGLCSGELMDWYLDQKSYPILGHEVCGTILESQDDRFPVGQPVFVHHHAPCLQCEMCFRRAYVHCRLWQSTRLVPGGMAERFALSRENLTDSFLVPELRDVDAALIEPLGCVAKSVQRARLCPGDRVAVIGLGSLGLAHALVVQKLGYEVIGYELRPDRRKWAQDRGIDARAPSQGEKAEVIFVCPGHESALRFALERAAPAARVVLFAPLPPGQPVAMDWCQLYFQDLEIVASYSCGPEDTREAAGWLRDGWRAADDLVSDFVALDELPEAYQKMKRGDLLKAMVQFT